MEVPASETIPRAHTSRANGFVVQNEPVVGDEKLECYGREKSYGLDKELEEFPLMPEELEAVLGRKGVIERHPEPMEIKEASPPPPFVKEEKKRTKVEGEFRW